MESELNAREERILLKAEDIVNKEPHLKSVLFDEKTIQQRIVSLAEGIGADFEKHGKICVIGVLKGAFIFMADLVRALAMTGRVKVRCEFIRASTYGDELKQSASAPQVELKLLPSEIEGQDILLIDDILDQGFTLAHLQQQLKEQGARSVKLCVLLKKELKQISPEVARLQSRLQVDYVGFTIKDEWVVGYGLDAAQEFRELPFLATVHEKYYL